MRAQTYTQHACKRICSFAFFDGTRVFRSAVIFFLITLFIVFLLIRVLFLFFVVLVRAFLFFLRPSARRDPAVWPKIRRWPCRGSVGGTRLHRELSSRVRVVGRFVVYLLSGAVARPARDRRAPLLDLQSLLHGFETGFERLELGALG